MEERDLSIEWDFNLKRSILAFIKNFFVLILVLTPILSYFGVSYAIQSNSPIDKVPYTHWNGLVPQSQTYISWETSDSLGSYVVYGTEENSLNNIVQNSSTIKMHHTVLNGLSPNTKYFYRAGSSATDLSEIHSFTTAPSTSEAVAFNFTIISDTQQFWGTGHYNLVANAINKAGDTSFVAYAGDVGQEPDDQDTWNFFMEGTSQFSNRIPIVPGLGNHDGDGGKDTLYAKYFNYSQYIEDPSNQPYKGYYSFNWSKTQFIMAELADMGDRDIDGDKATYNFEHWAWLNQTLQAGQLLDYRVLMFHRQLFSSSGDDASNLARYIPIIEKYNVSLVFYGHEHTYERFLYNGHTIICLGSGGGLQNAGVYEHEYQEAVAMGPSFTQILIDGDSVIVRTLSPSFDVIDEIKLEKNGNNLLPKEV